ncbi:head GIN domain-containing protein [Lacinutrix undariae]
MKKIIGLFILVLVFACDSEDANDCFQTTGHNVQQEFLVENFEKILVNRGVELFIEQGDTYTVIVESGENLINDVDVIVVGNQLEITDNNTCNFVRDYAVTKVYVTAPNIKTIRSSTQYEISSIGVLNYNNLSLISEDFNLQGSFTVGDFSLQLNATNLSIVSNNMSSFYLSGTAENVNVGFYSGSGRFEAEDLIAQNINVYHRGTNDMIVNPQLQLTGEIRSVGNVIVVNTPPLVTAQSFYTGHLVFED